MRTKISTTALSAFLLFLPAPVVVAAQDEPGMKQVLERLERLERENRALADELRKLRSEIAGFQAKPPAETQEAQGHSQPGLSELEEKMDIQERRVAEQAQTKVEASQRFPIRVTGMALFNAFLNSKQSGTTVENPPLASLARGPAFGGATLRQTVVGITYQGPEALWGGKVRGSAFFDFAGGTTQSLGNLLRLRTATIEIDWKNRGITAGQEKPLFSPREPNSLAQVLLSPLTGSGNLWLWQPQVRFEQRFQMGDSTTFRAQTALAQTNEQSASVPAPFASSLERARPAFQGRFELSHRFDGDRRFEFAPSFHTSATHVAATTVPSRLVSFDFFANPWKRLEATGFFFSGRNIALFGTGGIRQGFTFLAPGRVIPVQSKGGWSQLTFRAHSRLSFNVFGGIHDDRNRDLTATGIARNQTGAANLFFRIAPNVLVVFETAQTRTTYLGVGNRLNNHYDLALAYLF